MKQSFIAFLLLVYTTVLFAQQDSITFTTAQWETQTIAPGVTWKHYHFKKDLFNANQNINVLEIKLKKKRAIAIACEAKTLKPVSEFGKASNCHCRHQRQLFRH